MTFTTNTRHRVFGTAFIACQTHPLIVFMSAISNILYAQCVLLPKRDIYSRITRALSDKHRQAYVKCHQHSIIFGNNSCDRH